MVVKIPKKLEMKSLLPAPRSPLPAHVLAFPLEDVQMRRHKCLGRGQCHRRSAGTITVLALPHSILSVALRSSRGLI
jgi:hypothetical protein